MAGPLLEQLGLAEFFAAVYGAGFKPYVKPDPRIFDDVVADLAHAGPRRPVMIGDSVTDLNTARAAGAPCILMSYGYTPVPARVAGRGCGAGSLPSVAGHHPATALLMAYRFAA